MQQFWRAPRTLVGLVVAVLVVLTLLTGARSERLGDRYQVALPLLGLGCAAATGSAPEYVLRYAVLWTGIRTGKNALGHAPINLRPSGRDGGMPSGHTASAMFGASALAHGCLAASPPARAAALLAGGFTGASRIEAGAHTIWQVLAGVLWALACERGLRREGPLRAMARRWLFALGRWIKAVAGATVQGAGAVGTALARGARHGSARMVGALASGLATADRRGRHRRRLVRHFRRSADASQGVMRQQPDSMRKAWSDPSKISSADSP